MEPIQTMPKESEMLVSVTNVTPLTPVVEPTIPQPVVPQPTEQTPEPIAPPVVPVPPAPHEEVIIVEHIKGGYSWTRQILLVVLVLLAIIIIFSLIYLNGKSIYQYGI